LLRTFRDPGFRAYLVIPEQKEPQLQTLISVPLREPYYHSFGGNSKSPEVILPLSLGSLPVADRIGDARFGKRPQAQQATIANAAGLFAILVA